MRSGYPWWHPVTLVCAWGLSGYLPRAPGTWGSLAALPFAWAILETAGGLGLLIAAAVVTGIGILAIRASARRAGGGDHGWIVVDEVAGMWLTLCLVPATPAALLLGFLLFRVLDIAKPWPIGWLDRRVPGALGVMADDIAAGLIAAPVLLLIVAWGLPALTG